MGRTPDELDEESIKRMFIWLSLEYAQALAQDQNRMIRVTEQDDIVLPEDNDYRPGRLNLEVSNGIVTDIEIE